MQLECKYVIGIDPGSNGGIAVLEYPSKRLVNAHRLPKEEQDFVGVMKFYKPASACYVALEKVGTIFPRSKISPSPQSMFTFGAGYGFLRGLLVALDYEIHDVLPNEWQKTLHCNTKGDKNVTKDLAITLFPDIKITHAIADALLIAYYASFKVEIL